ncbi:hypothetical protein [Colwellia sp. TT2012]|uniref:hypothetical protein n=1 Tax=Colwellia sp. TT2012 TaxID=1720342 RepID=UPI000709AB41|nr:hypothetical protein [Colwellia sp. TT2012]
MTEGVKYLEQSDMLGNYWVNAYIRAASDGDDGMMMISLEATNLGDKTYTPASQSLIATGRSIQMKITTLRWCYLLITKILRTLSGNDSI